MQRVFKNVKHIVGLIRRNLSVFQQLKALVNYSRLFEIGNSLKLVNARIKSIVIDMIFLENLLSWAYLALVRCIRLAKRPLLNEGPLYFLERLSVSARTRKVLVLTIRTVLI